MYILELKYPICLGELNAASPSNFQVIDVIGQAIKRWIGFEDTVNS